MQKETNNLKNLKNYLQGKPILQALLSFLLIMLCEFMINYIISIQHLLQVLQ